MFNYYHIAKRAYFDTDIIAVIIFTILQENKYKRKYEEYFAFFM